MDDFLKKRSMPIGAEIFEDGVHFRVWAQDRKQVNVVFAHSTHQKFPLLPENNGYFSGLISEAKEGFLYNFQLDDDPIIYPDPASRFQPQGPHGPSQIINPRSYRWRDDDWRGIERKNAIIYEMHIGTFTPEGTWKSAMEELEELSKLGITVIEMMPVNEFSGNYGWGYDGVDLFAPMHVYGSPDDLRQFIDKAHFYGMAVILDVVYTHLGPDGNYLKKFSEKYFSNKYTTDWGEAVNFDEDAINVREFFITNAGYWIEEFHFDGLRVDAAQIIYDSSETHILSEIAEIVRGKAKNRLSFLTAEDGYPRIVRAPEKGGYGFDALWDDDFFCSIYVRVTNIKDIYFENYSGSIQEIISSLKYGFLYQGQWFKWVNKNRGGSAHDLEYKKVIRILQNHDYVANLFGKRIHQLTTPGIYRALVALHLLSLQIPLIFQGEEFASSSPFYFFADFNPEINANIIKSRDKFFSSFTSETAQKIIHPSPNPTIKETFLRCKLDFSERKTNAHIYNLYKDLIALRKNDCVFNQEQTYIDCALLNNDAFLVRYFSDTGERLLIINLGPEFLIDPPSEPLLAPPDNHSWEICWYSNNLKYGATDSSNLPSRNSWRIPQEIAIVLKSIPKQSD